MTRKDITVPLTGYREYPLEEMRARAAEFYAELRRRRTVREFSDRPIPRDIIEECIRAAGTSPSGGNVQPWRFIVVSNPAVKKLIRKGAEREDREFYSKPESRDWSEVVAPLATRGAKPYLEVAPYLIAIFAQTYGLRPDGTKVKYYYAAESVGIATGILVAALHRAGLACLIHTPSPLGSLNDILGRPENERPFLLLAVGYPAEGARVPESVKEKKGLEEIAEFIA